MIKSNWIIGFILLILSFHGAVAQSYPGFISGNYAGASGIIHQPASIADNAYRWDIVLVGINVFADNNFGKIKRSRAFMNFNFGDAQHEIIEDTETKYGLMNFEITGPSFMVRLKKLNAIGFTSRVRTYINLDVTGDFSKAWAGGFNDSALFDQSFANQQMYLRLNSWQEYGLTYAQVIQDTPSRKIKAGVTAKLLIENGGAQVDFATGTFQNIGPKLLLLPQFSINYGYSNQLQNIIDGGYSFFGGKKGFGMDLGLVYEYYKEKRGYTPSTTKMITGYNKTTNKTPKYKYKLGFALLDIGRLKYTYGTYSGSASVVSDGTDILDLNNLDGTYDNPNVFSDSLQNMVDYSTSSGTYTMGLPAAFQANLDYRFKDKVYINTNVYASLSSIQWADYKVHDISNITITPRWENNWLGFYLPFYVNLEGQFNMGLATHIGPLVLGLHDFLPFLVRKESTSAGAYFMLKTFIPNKKKKKKSKIKCTPDGWEPNKRRSLK